MGKIKNTVEFVNTFGIKRSIKEMGQRIYDRYHEKRLGVETGEIIPVSAFGFDPREQNEYMAMNYWGIYSMLKRVPLDISNSVFLDYGAGKGLLGARGVVLCR